MFEMRVCIHRQPGNMTIKQQPRQDHMSSYKMTSLSLTHTRDVKMPRYSPVMPERLDRVDILDKMTLLKMGCHCMGIYWMDLICYIS